MSVAPLLAFLLTIGFAAPQGANAADPRVYAYGYDGCELLVMTEFFELAPGESFQMMVDQSQCFPRDIGRVAFWGYTTRGSWRARELLVRDGVDLKMHDLSDGLELNYASLGGYETLGDLEQCGVQLSEAGFLLLSAENTTRQSKTVKMHFQAGYWGLTTR